MTEKAGVAVATSDVDTRPSVVLTIIARRRGQSAGHELGPWMGEGVEQKMTCAKCGQVFRVKNATEMLDDPGVAPCTPEAK